MQSEILILWKWSSHTWFCSSILQTNFRSCSLLENLGYALVCNGNIRPTIPNEYNKKLPSLFLEMLNGLLPNFKCFCAKVWYGAYQVEELPLEFGSGGIRGSIILSMGGEKRKFSRKAKVTQNRKVLEWLQYRRQCEWLCGHASERLCKVNCPELTNAPIQVWKAYHPFWSLSTTRFLKIGLSFWTLVASQWSLLLTS